MAALRCAYCHAPLSVEARATGPGCATVLHAECVREAGTCPTLGCAGRSARTFHPAGQRRVPARIRALATGITGAALFALVWVLAPAVATTVRLENRSGRRLERVELQFCNEDWRPWSPLRASVLEPGESIELRVYHPLPIIALHEASYVLDGRVIEPAMSFGPLMTHGAILAVEPSGELIVEHPRE